MNTHTHTDTQRLIRNTIDFYFRCFFFFFTFSIFGCFTIFFHPHSKHLAWTDCWCTRKWRRSSSKSTRINNYFLVFFFCSFILLRLRFCVQQHSFSMRPMRFKMLLYWHFGYYNSCFVRIVCVCAVWCVWQHLHIVVLYEYIICMLYESYLYVLRIGRWRVERKKEKNHLFLIRLCLCCMFLSYFHFHNWHI